MGKDNKGSYNEAGQYVKTSRDGQYFNAYSSDPSKSNHERLTIKTDNKGNFSYSYHNGDKSKKESGSGTGCYLTSSCMQHFQENFDDNCYELRVLRWFRDNFVSKEDIAHYYEIAPTIVEAIESNPSKSNLIYDYIYDNIIDVCVEAIENGDYEFAYNRYKNSILIFEEIFAKPRLEDRLIKSLENSLC